MKKLFGIEKLADDLAEALHAEVIMCEDCVSKSFKWTPIEMLFYVGFYFYSAGKVNRLFLRNAANEKATPIEDAKARMNEMLECDVYVFPQCLVNGHRVDFVICHKIDEDAYKWVAVECDGHDFHERTKEQAARDRSIDRKLQADGFVVMRFTGSELFRDPLKCVKEAAAALSIC